MKIHELFAYLRVKNAAAAIDFYKTAFGATEKFRLTEPSGRIGSPHRRSPSFLFMIDQASLMKPSTPSMKLSISKSSLPSLW